MIRNYCVDKITKMGKEHKICQDYSDSFQCNSDLITNFIIISDGCSSSKDTDIGSRIISRLARKIISHLHFVYKHLTPDNIKDSYEFFGDMLITMALPIIHALGIDNSALDSTLIVTFVYENNIYTFMYGDGVIITVDKNNKITFTEIQFKNNAPYYLSAKILHSDMYKLHTDEPNMIIRDSYTSIPADSDHQLYYVHNIDMYKCIIIASDGLTSFKNYSNDNDPNVDDVITNLCNIKNYKGEFIQRRVNRMINEYAKNNIFHYDDLSVAGISIFDSEE